MPNSEHLPKVLISHSWKDKKETMTIADGLRELNCAQVWIDFENMKAGVDINEELYTQIQSSDFLILVWTPNSMNSENVHQEIKWALKFDIPIIPCYFHFEENGEISSKLHKNLLEITGKNLLWVEFRNHNNGIMELYSSLYTVESKRLPKEVSDQFSEKHRILKRMEGYNKYLINYRNIKDRDADRKSWITRIMKEIDTLENSGLSKELIAKFMNGLKNLENSDPEAYQVLKPQLDKYFSKNKPPAHQPKTSYQYQNPSSVLNPFHLSALESLRTNFLAMLEKENARATSFEYLGNSLPLLTPDQKAGTIQGIINVSADGLFLLDQAYIMAQESGLSAEFSPILDYVTHYYFEVEDLRSDESGFLGWVDDTYLCFSSLQKINHFYYSIFQQFLIDTDLNPYLQFLMQLLNQNEIHQLDSRVNNRFSSIDWHTLLIKLTGFTINNLNFGYQQVNQPASQGSFWGGTWEDEMAERAARLGISWNY